MASPSPSGRPMHRGSAWLAISTSGTAAAISCANASRPASGSCSSPAWRKAPSTNSSCWPPMAACCRSRPIRSASITSCRRRPARASTVCPATSGRTTTGWPTARRGRRSRRRSRPTRFTSAHGGARTTTRSSAMTSSAISWCPTPATWASPISNACRSRSIPSPAHGATSRSACSPPPAATAARRISRASSTRRTRPVSASSSTGCRRTFPATFMASPTSTAPRSTSTPTRASASIATGTR